MKKIIRENGEENDVSEEDIVGAVELATKLGKTVDRFDVIHFFLVLDALGGVPNRDGRTNAVFEMALAAHRVLARADD